MENIELLREVTLDYQRDSARFMMDMEERSREYIDKLVDLGLTTEEAMELYMEASASMGREYLKTFGDDEDMVEEATDKFMEMLGD